MCTFERRTHFTDHRTVDVIRTELLRTASAYDVEVIAYCFMPDHLHVVIEGMTENADLLKFTAMFRQRSGHQYRSVHGEYLWQEGYVDRFLRDDEATLDVVRYVVANPLSRPGRDDIPKEIALPPSGFVAGIYARNDNDPQHGVHKAPANEVVTGALRFELDINFSQQEQLNPLGINCLRYLSGRGYRLWGARLASSDPEWKYVSDRRYFNYLEASIDRGTQWAVFELNGERLWANVRQTISDFLYNEWRNGALLGANAEEAFFVRCDRSTMTQNDLDNGRLICLIGVAPTYPAEFVIFRIGQFTADAVQS